MPITLRRAVIAALVLITQAVATQAQVLVANDDFFAVRHGLTLEVESWGVLENDELDGENAG